MNDTLRQKSAVVIVAAVRAKKVRPTFEKYDLLLTPALSVPSFADATCEAVTS